MGFVLGGGGCADGFGCFEVVGFLFRCDGLSLLRLVRIMGCMDECMWPISFETCYH